MTANNFRDLLDPIEHFKASDGMWSTRILDADDLLARPVPWVDCPACKGSGRIGCPGPSGGGARTQRERDALGLRKGIDYCYGMHMGHPCPTCTGTGKATVAQLLAWGSAVAQPLTDWGNYHLGFGDPAVDAVEDWRNRILDTRP